MQLIVRYFLLNILFFTLLLSSSCSSINTNKFFPSCKKYDYLEFCNFDAYKNEKYVDILRQTVKVPDSYVENLKLKKHWNNIIRKVSEGEIEFRKQRKKYESTEIAKLIRKKGKTKLIINSFSNYDFTRFIQESKKREHIIDLPQYITRKYDMLYYNMCETVFDCEGRSRFIPLSKNSIIEDLKIKKRLYSDSLYIDESIKDFSNKMMSIYTDGKRKVFITNENLPPQIDRMGNLFVNLANIEGALNVVMLHEAVHIIDPEFSTAIMEYAYNIRSSEKFLSSNKRLLKYSLITPFGMDLYKGDESIVLNAHKETIIDAKVLGLLKNNKRSCMRYLNVLRNNIVHKSQKLRINFVNIGCELMSKKSYNVDSLFSMMDEFSTYKYSEESVELLTKRVPNYAKNLDIQLSLIQGIIDEMFFTKADDKKLFVSFIISMVGENPQLILKE